MTPATGPGRLRALLAGDEVVHLPGVHDAVTARLAAAAGARAACLSGAVTSAVALGLPDLGYLTGGDVAARAAQLVPSLAGVPLLADADTGYGGPLQVRRTVEQYAAAGIAGLHLEDQVAPKRCGHLAGKAVVELAEAAARVRAAVDAARDVGGGLVVVARTDALGVEGPGSAVDRALAFADAGADAVLVEGADVAALAAVRDALLRRTGVPLPLVVSRSEAGGPVDRGPDDAALAALGVRLVIHPVSTLLATARAAADAIAAVLRDGSAGAVPRLQWDTLTDLLDQPAHLDRADRYAPAATPLPA